MEHLLEDCLLRLTFQRPHFQAPRKEEDGLSHMVDR